MREEYKLIKVPLITLTLTLLLSPSTSFAVPSLGTFFLDFDGGNDTFRDDNIANTINLEAGAFELSKFNIADNAENRTKVQAGIVQNLNKLFTGYDIGFTTALPSTGLFSTLYVGEYKQGPDAAGFSETLDFLNEKKDDNGFIFTDKTGSITPGAINTVDGIALSLANV